MIKLIAKYGFSPLRVHHDAFSLKIDGQSREVGRREILDDL
jgi:hypothetical protein